MIRLQRFSFLFVLILFPGQIFSQKISRQDYIEQYRDLAMSEMLRSGVPASIKLAQGILETNNGNSTLATRANNHFGIKCHDWQGRKVYHDDDAPDECFRRYKSAKDSYLDHSDFLRNRSRYAFLFDLDITDYKAWAKGLKRAGYATSRTYAERLITIIEDNELYQYDYLALNEEAPRKIRKLTWRNSRNLKSDRIQLNNRIKYIVVEEGETLQSIQEEFDLMRNELQQNNELASDAQLIPGQILYLQPKRKKAERGREYHFIRERESLYSISQAYGIKLESLYEMNNLLPGDSVELGTKINLRRKKKGDTFLRIEDEQPQETEEFRFEFDG